jgi:hypothetical protein
MSTGSQKRFSNRKALMFDEMDRLRQSKELFDLLEHYLRLAGEDRQVWHDRLLETEGTSPAELVRFHGELLAYGWLEQNTGIAIGSRIGAAPACYRITPGGIRALRQAREEVPA